MKKYLALAAMAAAVLAFASCEKDNKDNNGGDDEGTVKREWRVKTMDSYTFSYDAQGRVASVVTTDDNRVFSYDGTKFTITDNGTVEYTGTLNADGFVVTMKTADGATEWANTYDKNGYLTSSKQNGTETTRQSIEDGNILWWGRWDKDNNFWRRKEATYLDKDNLGGVQTHWAEDVKGSKRWMWEARMFGNTSAKVLESCVWVNFGDVKAPKTAVYTYEYDANGLITKETKYYGEWNETDTTGMDFDDEHSFTWEKIK